MNDEQRAKWLEMAAQYRKIIATDYETFGPAYTLEEDLYLEICERITADGVAAERGCHCCNKASEIPSAMRALEVKP